MRCWTTQPCRPGRYTNRDQSTRAAHQPRSTQRDRLDQYRQRKIHPAQSYVNIQQSEGPSRRHNGVEQSGGYPRPAKRKDICDHCISTAISRTNSLRHSRARDFTGFSKAKHNRHSRISTPSIQAKTLLDDIVVSTRAV